jgi:hypothetical protein
VLHAHGLTLYAPEDLDRAGPDLADLRRIAAWAVEFLNAPNEGLGRRGPVCPFTPLSMQRSTFLLAHAEDGPEVRAIEAKIERYRQIFLEVHDRIDGPHGHLLTILVVLPRVDPVDPGPLDDLQARLKDAFVREGLMVGQFHPRCEQSGLWNDDFRPLRAPVPLLAIRRMVSSDLPFLLDSPEHLSAYLTRFAPDIPGHVRRLLIERVTA